MADGCGALTEKEKETLRLIVRGHDAKSTARHLGLSVHTVNERLRDARRKLAVSSSREAARLLLEREGDGPEMRVDKQLREADRPPDMEEQREPENGRRRSRRFARIAAGVLCMSLVLALVALAMPPQSAAPPADAPPITAGADDTAIEATARGWLTLLDQGRWDESWAATGAAFRKLNTSAVWAAASERVRAPLGAVRSRTFLSHEDLPAPPHGYDVVKFRTDFANKSGAVETVTLDREGGAWRVVGITVG